MALIFLDGCDHYAATDLAKKWSAYSGANLTGSGSRRSGTNVISLLNNATSYYVERNIDGTPTTLTIGLAFRVLDATWTSHKGIEIYRSGSVQATVAIDDTLKIRVYRGAVSGGTLLATSTWAGVVGVWYYLEASLTIDDAAGTYNVDINGQSVLSATGVDTKETGTAGIDAVRVNGCNTGTDSDLFIGDVYMRNDLTRHGDCRVDKITPTSNGNYAQWDPFSGSNYQMIDDLSSIDDDATYNSTDVLNEIDTFVMSDVSAIGSTIHAVATTICMRKTDVGARGVTPLLRISGTDYSGSEHSIGDAYACWQNFWTTNPNTAAAWTEAGINGLEAGYKLTT